MDKGYGISFDLYRNKLIHLNIIDFTFELAEFPYLISISNNSDSSSGVKESKSLSSSS